MQIVGVILVLISVGCIAGPIGGVVVVYRDDLPDMVIPPQIQELMSGNGNFLLNDNTFKNGGGNGGDNPDNSSGNGSGDNSGSFINPVFVSADIDSASKTFSVTVNVTNGFNYTLTLNSINATVEENTNHVQLATIALLNPVTIPVGATSQVTVSGTWTQAAETLVSQYTEGQSINVSLINLTIDVNGIIIQQTEPVNVGAIPLSLEGP